MLDDAKLQIGLILENGLEENWVNELLSKLLTKCDIKILINVNSRMKSEIRLSSYFYRKFLIYDYQRHSKHIKNDALKTERYYERLETIADMTMYAKSVDGSIFMDDAVTQAISSAKLDILLNLSPLIFPEKDVNSLIRYGVWSWFIGHSDLPLIGEISRRSSVFELGWRICIHDKKYRYRSFNHTRMDSIYLNQNTSYWKLIAMALRCIDNIVQSESHFFSTIDEDDETMLPRKTPVIAVIFFVIQWFLLKINHRMINTVSYEKWMLAVADRKENSYDFTGLDSFLVLESAKGHVLADPFLFEKNNKLYIFFEEIAANSPKGMISCAMLSDRGLENSKVILKTNYHLSYPFVFDYEGSVFMIPESSENGTIDLYRAVNFPDEWVLDQHLMTDVRAVDTTIYYHDQLFWMFTTMASFGADLYSELFLFYSDSIRGPWHPHPKNPVISDVRVARPAGRIYERNGVLIRPGQDCSKSYGYQIMLNQIDVLSKEDYREHIVGTMGPGWRKLNLATHTLSFSQKYVMVDVRRRIWRISKFFNNLK